jgi:hypothetical protein
MFQYLEDFHANFYRGKIPENVERRKAICISDPLTDDKKINKNRMKHDGMSERDRVVRSQIKDEK